jgi:hypothetical protein
MVHDTQGNYAASRHGGLGIASFIIGVLSIILDFGIFTIAGIIKASGQQTPAVNMIVGACMFLLLGLCLLGIGLGIAGAVDKTSRKAFPVIGIVLCAGVFVLTVVLVAIGIAMVRHGA